VLTITPFGPLSTEDNSRTRKLSAEDRTATAEESAGLLAFLAPAAANREVRFA
jgi:hypothetical protein